MSQGKEKIENCDFAAAKDSNQSNSSRREAGQSTQPPVKKIKLEQLEQPSTTGSSATECLRHLQQNICSEPPYTEFFENTQEYEEEQAQQDYQLHLLNETLHNLNKVLDHLQNNYY